MPSERPGAPNVAILAVAQTIALSGVTPIVLLGGIMHVGDRTGDFDVPCPAGKKVLGGGVATFNRQIDIPVSTPTDDGRRWSVRTQTFDNSPIAVDSSVNIRVTCANVDAAPAAP